MRDSEAGDWTVPVVHHPQLHLLTLVRGLLLSRMHTSVHCLPPTRAGFACRCKALWTSCPCRRRSCACLTATSHSCAVQSSRPWSPSRTVHQTICSTTASTAATRAGADPRSVRLRQGPGRSKRPRRHACRHCAEAPERAASTVTSHRRRLRTRRRRRHSPPTRHLSQQTRLPRYAQSTHQPCHLSITLTTDTHPSQPTR